MTIRTFVGLNQRSEHYHGNASTTDSDANSLPKSLESQQMYRCTSPRSRNGVVVHDRHMRTVPPCFDTCRE